MKKPKQKKTSRKKPKTKPKITKAKEILEKVAEPYHVVSELMSRVGVVQELADEIRKNLLNLYVLRGVTQEEVLLKELTRYNEAALKIREFLEPVKEYIPESIYNEMMLTLFKYYVKHELSDQELANIIDDC
ncbi:MAG: hypothetical protein ACK416_00470, partial [Zestosphaera sp.]